MLSQFSAMGVVQSQVPHLQDIGFPLGTAATALGGIGLVSAFSKISFGWLCDRIKPKYACAIGILFSIGGIFVLMNTKPTSPMLILWLYVLIFGFGAGHWLPVVSMLVSTTFGMASYGTIFGLVILFLNFGVSLGPLTAGYIFDSTNSYSWAFSIFITLGILAILAILCVRQPRAGGRGGEEHFV
jgi:MFS family permease